MTILANAVDNNPRPAQLRKNAELLLAARLSRVALPEFPGILPKRLSDAYMCQDHGIALRRTPIAGWKVGFIAPERRDERGDERVLGPIFADQLTIASENARYRWRFIDKGFAAVEAEYVFKLGVEIGPRAHGLDDPHLAALVASVHIGIELAGSPMRDINRIGPLAVASDFGNNNGLILGPKLAMHGAELHDPSCWAKQQAASSINGKMVGSGGGANIPGSPWSAFTFAVRRLLERGYSLSAGTLIATGASTGIHEMLAGDRATLTFWSSDAPTKQVRLHCDVHTDLSEAFELVVDPPA